MNKLRKQSGLVLIYVIVLIPLLSVGILVVTQNTLLLIKHTRRVQLQADAQNLLHSGLAWAEIHKNELCRAEDGQIFELQLQKHPNSHSSCSLTVLSKDNRSCSVQIEASSRSGHMSVEQKKTLTIFNR